MKEQFLDLLKFCLNNKNINAAKTTSKPEL